MTVGAYKFAFVQLLKHLGFTPTQCDHSTGRHDLVITSMIEIHYAGRIFFSAIGTRPALLFSEKRPKTRLSFPRFSLIILGVFGIVLALIGSLL